MRFSDMQKSITFRSFSRGTSALLDSLSPSLCCLHPCHGKELWKVFQLCSNSIYLPSSSGITMGSKKSFLLPVPVQRRQLLFSATPGWESEFLWVLWLTWDGLDSHLLFPTISDTPCASLHNTASFHRTTGTNVWTVNQKNRFKSLYFFINY